MQVFFYKLSILVIILLSFNIMPINAISTIIKTDNDWSCSPGSFPISHNATTGITQCSLFPISRNMTNTFSNNVYLNGSINNNIYGVADGRLSSNFNNISLPNQNNAFYDFIVNGSNFGHGLRSGYNCNLWNNSPLPSETNCYISSVTATNSGYAKAIHGTAIDQKGSSGIIAGVIGQVIPNIITQNSRAVSAEDTGNVTGKSTLFYGYDIVPQLFGLSLGDSSFTDAAIVLHSTNGDTHSSRIRAQDGTYFYFDNNYAIHIGNNDGDHFILQNGYQSSMINIVEPKRIWQIQAYNDSNGDYLRVIGPSIGNVLKIDNYGHVWILDNVGHPCWLDATSTGSMTCQH